MNDESNPTATGATPMEENEHTPPTGATAHTPTPVQAEREKKNGTEPSRKDQGGAELPRKTKERHWKDGGKEHQGRDGRKERRGKDGGKECQGKDGRKERQGKDGGKERRGKDGGKECQGKGGENDPIGAAGQREKGPAGNSSGDGPRANYPRNIARAHEGMMKCVFQPFNANCEPYEIAELNNM
jgi:ATP-dependent RNA helicase SUPV3L1/SUV3